MAQLEHPANLPRFDNPAYRLITIVLMRSGLRVTDALRLRADCITTDAEGAPYLRYFNHKMSRDALVPIDDRPPRPDQRTPPPHPRPLAGRDTDAVPAPDQERRRHAAVGRHPPTGPRYCAGWPRCDIRDDTGQPGPPDAAPLASHPRHPADQPGCPAGGRAPHPRPRLTADDRPLRPNARHHRQTALGIRPQGRHHRPHSRFRPRRAARRRRLGQTAPRPSNPGPAQRLTVGCRCSSPARTPTPA